MVIVNVVYQPVDSSFSRLFLSLNIGHPYQEGPCKEVTRRIAILERHYSVALSPMLFFESQHPTKQMLCSAATTLIKFCNAVNSEMDDILRRKLKLQLT